MSDCSAMTPRKRPQRSTVYSAVEIGVVGRTWKRMSNEVLANGILGPKELPMSVGGCGLFRWIRRIWVSSKFV